ncbi:MAG: alpha-amylase, partial [Gammaproteobacteria bacterium]|nr:alpha-amylase [Gammaproteobacteria bacterium]
MMTDVRHRLLEHLIAVYGDVYDSDLIEGWAARILQAAQLSPDSLPPEAHRNLWSEADVAVITYGDSIITDGELPLKTLHRFLTQQLGSLVSWVHILPFHPWTSDDGFAVLDYSSVNEAL